MRIGDILQDDFMVKYELLKSKHLQLLQVYNYDFELEEAEEQWFEAIEKLKSYQQVESVYYINEALKSGKRILAEGAQGSMLDIDFGTYPFVTSSNTITAAVCTGLGVSPQNIGEVIGITKAYCTRVGGGPFPSELEDEVGEKLRKEGAEFGATTGRPRRCGWIDLPALNYTCIINGVTKLVITKADILNAFDEFGICTQYKIDGIETNELPFDMVNKKIEPVYSYFKSWGNIDNTQTLPQELQAYVTYLEKYLNTKVSMVSNGPGREQLIELEAIK
ncbi:MAG: adenylosuccinate synthetase [Chitinophagales bacterium]